MFAFNLYCVKIFYKKFKVVICKILQFGRYIMAQGKISAKQLEILEYIKSQILERGFPPSVRDICEAVILKSTSSVHSHLETLKKNGYIRRDPTKPRAIEILDESF